MAQDQQQTPKPARKRRASRSVYIFDKTANVVIRTGGIFVVCAVLGLVAFIFSQVLPLFGSPEQGALQVKPGTASDRAVYAGFDEYRRVAVRITESGQVEIASALSGEVLTRTPIAGLGKNRVTCASVALLPYAWGFFDNVANTPQFAVAVGTSDGRVLAGTLAFITDYMRFELGQEPETLKALPVPSEAEFKRPDYLPRTVIQSLKGKPWVVEHLADFGFYRYMRADIVFDRQVGLPTTGEPISSVQISVEHGEPEAELEQLVGAITASGRALVSLETISLNAMSGERNDPQSLYAGELSSHIDGPASLVQVNVLRTEALFATRRGVVYVFHRSKDKDTRNQFVVAYPGVAVLGFDAQEGQDWRQTATDSRDDGAEPQGKLELTAMSYLLGDSTVLLGDSYGGVQAWFAVRETEEDTNPRLRRIRALPGGSGAVLGFSSSHVSKSFITWDDSGRIRGIHNTSERVFFDVKAQGKPVSCSYGSKADGVLCLDDSGGLQQWWVDPGHSEVSFKTLFGKVFYEGYLEPRYEWQSHAGTDDVETKLSMMPLILGSLKGGMYALLFALPLAVLAAIYTSEFMAPRLRSVIKPSMEVMASLPSVVLGFLGALYFAPEAAPNMPSLVVFALLTPTLFMLFGWIFGQLPPYVTKRFGPFTTIAALVVVLVFGAVAASTLGPRLESHIFPALEGANPAQLEATTFQPTTEEAAVALSAGDFRSWTDGGRSLPRPLTTQNGTLLPKGWWLPGGHALFATLLVLPFALLGGLLLKLGHALLFGGRVLGRELTGRTGRPSPLARLRTVLAGGQGVIRPVVVDVGFSLGFALLAFAVGVLLSGALSGPLESLLFSYDHPTAGHVADFRRWLTGPTGWKFNQTNSLIVGFAMGFAVIPIIYSIAEDALSSVPNQMRAASLACGASRWQTAMRVVVPAAASGIFSAIVIGLGRALGETMIVVMAAGGTPLTELQPLSGFRSLSAAIAIEMPEAPKDSTHYRTLFLGGLLLFLMTFVISTMAEFVRMRLRKKLSRM